MPRQNLRSDQAEIAEYTRIANNYRNWMHMAYVLFAGSRILSRERDSARAKVSRPGRAHWELATLWIEIMLAAFGIETLLKSVWVKKGHEIVRNGKYRPLLPKERHQLVPICERVGITLDDRERDVLKRMSVISCSLGRYPIATDFSRTRLRRFLNSSGSPITWSHPDDDNVVSSLVSRLRRTVRAK